MKQTQTLETDDTGTTEGSTVRKASGFRPWMPSGLWGGLAAEPRRLQRADLSVWVSCPWPPSCIQSTTVPPGNQVSRCTSWRGSWTPPPRALLFRLLRVSGEQHGDTQTPLLVEEEARPARERLSSSEVGQLPRPLPPLVAWLGPCRWGLSSLHILGSSFRIVDRCCTIHDLPPTCALSCCCMAWGSTGTGSLSPPHRGKAESILGRVTRSLGGPRVLWPRQDLYPSCLWTLAGFWPPASPWCYFLTLCLQRVRDKQRLERLHPEKLETP